MRQEDMLTACYCNALTLEPENDPFQDPFDDVTKKLRSGSMDGRERRILGARVKYLTMNCRRPGTVAVTSELAHKNFKGLAGKLANH